MTLSVYPVAGLPEVVAGDDLGALIVAHVDPPLRDGDVLVVTSKVVSKAEGRVVRGSRADLLAEQTDRVVAQRGALRIVRTAQGLTMAAAGIDASNTTAGTVVLLPVDPDASARWVRRGVEDLTGTRIGVVVTDTAGRAWRHGQTDIAIGVAGLLPFVDLAGSADPYGNRLDVTAPAIADEIAGAGDLVKGKLDRVPVAVVRGTPPGWLCDDDGPGASALVRAEATDLFGLGAADAVVAAVIRTSALVRGFPAPEPDALDRLLRTAASGVDPALAAAVVEVRPGLSTRRPGALSTVVVRVREDSGPAWLEAGRLIERLRTLGVALGVRLEVAVAASGADPGSAEVGAG